MSLRESILSKLCIGNAAPPTASTAELGCSTSLMGESAWMNVWLRKTVMNKLAQTGGNIPSTGWIEAKSMRTLSRQGLLVILMLGLVGLPALADPCTAPQIQKVATAKDIKAFVKGKKMKVLTFTGYSGAGYEDQGTMLEKAGEILARQDPRKTLINIGATAEGVGAVYALAKQQGFRTMGVVSALAREEKLPLSPCVDFVFFVRDRTWGGNLPDSRKLAPTSAALVSVSSELAGIGGGEVARDEMQAARKAGKPVTYFPADMNHQLARDKAAKKGLAEPSDFRGAADSAFRDHP